MELRRVRRLAQAALLWIAPVLGLATLAALEPSQILGPLYAGAVALGGLVVAVCAAAWLAFDRPDARAPGDYTPGQILRVGVAAFCVLPATLGIENYLEYRARCWLESFAPEIDAHVAQVGSPPKSFAAVDAPSPAAPYLARIGHVDYWEEDGHYGFRIWTGFSSAWSWSSADRIWGHHG